MNELPSTSNVVFSYLLILVVAGVVISEDEFRVRISRDLIYLPESDLSYYDSAKTVAIINAEARLPIYAAPENGNPDNRQVGGAQVRVINHAFMSVSAEPSQNNENGRTSWQINIASVTNRIKAIELRERAHADGVDAALTRVSVKGKNYWRVSVKGLASPGEAASYATVIKDRLRLKKVWISKEFPHSVQ